MKTIFDFIKVSFQILIDTVATLFNWIDIFLSYKISEFDNNPLTIGKLLLGILFLCAGLYFLRKLLDQIERRILNRLDVDRPIRDTIKTVIFYFLNLILILFTLRLLNIPITVLTVVGGAFAFAIGLGAQSIVYDLLSGFVIILEHPIRKADLIEVDNIVGRVEQIGVRATRLLTLDNKHLIVPNNFFMSKTILNWTLSDEVIRSEVKVGLTYVSDVEKVSSILTEVAIAHPRVRKDPAPQVIFEDFGNSALIFNLSFYAPIKDILDLRRIKSDLRFSLAKSLKENNLVIAFPQRDLHFRGDSDPVKIQILSEKPQK